MPIQEGDNQLKIGFIRREAGDTFANLLVAPGGKIEPTDGNLTDGVQYDCVEECAIREMMEETGIDLQGNDLFYFCSLVLPNGRVVISMKAYLDAAQNSGKLIWLTKEEIAARTDFAPGMQQEALLVFESEGV
jgi:8-oxo-dGTP pyrophosphatase MutT (NUDIX family)